MKYLCLICCHNPAKNHILAQVRSIKRTGSIDIVLFDFGSLASVREYLLELSEKYSFSYVERANAQGARHSFLEALKYRKIAEYDYVFLSDQDDVWRSEKLKIVDFVCRNYSPDVLFHDVEVFRLGERLGSYYQLKGRSIERELNKIMLVSSNIGIGHTFCLSKSFISMFNDRSSLWEALMHDWDILLYAAGQDLNIKYVDLRLSYYRIHENNLIGLNTSKNMKLKEILKYAKTVDDFISQYYRNDGLKLLMSFTRLRKSIRIGAKRFLLEFLLLLYALRNYKYKH